MSTPSDDLATFPTHRAHCPCCGKMIVFPIPVDLIDFRHAYEEAPDLAVYLRKIIEEEAI